jgi:hypothetical protein
MELDVDGWISNIGGRIELTSNGIINYTYNIRIID